MTPLAQTLRDTLRPLLHGAGSVALLDFPNYSNTGDTAIYLGTRAVLASLGFPEPMVEASLDAPLKGLALPEDCVVLLMGGGNFGDLYPKHQQYRERVARSYPGHRIVQLPQTLRFMERASLMQAQRVFRSHGDTHLLVRDRHSLAAAEDMVGAERATLCPDMAHALERPEAVAASAPLGWLVRRDTEALTSVPVGLGGTFFDWRDTQTLGERLTTRALQSAFRLTATGTPMQRKLMSFARARARERLDTGLRALARFETVVTDRLHGHILCEVLGIPHVVVDNNNAKLSGYLKEFGARHTVPYLEARSLAEAQALVGQLARRPEGVAAHEVIAA